MSYPTFYRSWFPRAPFNPLVMDSSDKELSFKEIVAKYPSTTPVRELSESGDVLWKFTLFPDQQAFDAYPEEIPKRLALRNFVINETKGFHVQFIQEVCYAMGNPKEKKRVLEEYEVCDYLNVDGVFFPKQIENRMIMDGEVHYNRDDVSKVRFNVQDLDLDSFTIPEYTDVTYTADGAEPVTALKLKHGEPLKFFKTEDEYLNFLKIVDNDLKEEREKENMSKKVESVTLRFTLFALGAGIIILALWKRRKRLADLSNV